MRVSSKGVRWPLDLIFAALLLLLTCGRSAGATALVTWGRNVEEQANIPSPLTDAVAIAAGGSHSLTLRANGTVAAWGASGGTNVPPDLTNVVAIAAGTDFSLALRSDGTVSGWGLPEVAPPNDLREVISISAGRSHAVALKRNRTVVSWGNNTYGQTNVPAGLSNVIAIAGGLRWTFVLHEDGTLISWGLNGSAQTNVPVNTTNVVAIASAGAVNLALNSNGTIAVGGPGSTPAPLDATNCVSIAAGYFHRLAIRDDATVLAWGENAQGQSTVPAEATNVTQISGGLYHSLALISELAPNLWHTPSQTNVVASGKAIRWFAGATGLQPMRYQWRRGGADIPGADQPWFFIDDLQLGDSGEYSVVVSNAHGSMLSPIFRLGVTNVPPAFIQQPIAQPVSELGSFTLQAGADGSYPLTYQWLRNGQPIVGATNSTLAVSNASTADAAVYSVRAANRFGEEFSSVARVTVPRLVAWGSITNVPPDSDDIVAISAGTTRSLFLRRDGTLTGSHTVPALSNLALIASGDYHDLALLSNGTVIAWGDHFSGQTNVPPGLHDIVALAGGEAHSVALQGDGTVIEWGRYGQGGAAQAPAGLSNVIAIAAGHSHTLAVRGDGTVAAWGSSAFGKTMVPSNLTDVVAVAGGYDHSVALKQDGTVVVWGIYSPTNVPPAATNIVAISSRDFHILALRSDGAVIAWNGSGIIAPFDLKNVASISAGTFHSLALMRPPDFQTFLAHSLDGNGISLNLPTEVGRNYTLETAGQLPSNWSDSQILSGNGTHQTFVTNITGSARFFRMRVD